MTDKKMTVVDAEVVGTNVPQNPYLPMIDKALSSELGIGQLDKILDLQIRWEENEARKAFHRAFAAFKSESIEILKDKKVGYDNRDGSRTGYTHATLGRIVETVTPYLSKHGLSHRWDVQQDGSNATVTCYVTHELGHSAQVTMTAGKDDSGKKNLIQQVASTVTYLQRYTFLAVTGLAAKDQDDDGVKHDAPDIEYITEAQVMDLESLIAEVKADADKLCVFYKISDLAQLPATKYDAVVKALELKRKEAK